MQANKIFTMSENGKQEYCCKVVRIEDIFDIPGSDFLGQTFVNNEPVVVRKDLVHTGDIMIYAMNETQLNQDFLSKNSMFRLNISVMNANSIEVETLLRQGKKDEAQAKCGFFEKNGRVRMIKIRKTPSMGILLDFQQFVTWKPSLANLDITELEGMIFDTVENELFVKAYIPPFSERHGTPRNNNKNQKILKRFDRLIEGEFFLHYDTNPLAGNEWKLNPDQKVALSVKMHGTSAIFANVKTRIPLKLPFYKRWWNKLLDATHLFYGFRVVDSEVGYGNIYSSRKVIKNKYINKEVTSGYYGQDVWGKYNDLLKDYIPQGMTIYGEICGYLDGTQTMIQKGYDYGCAEGENFFMPYRITSDTLNGKYEWNVDEVRDWTVHFREEHPEFRNLIYPIPILFKGHLTNLYPDIDSTNVYEWRKNILAALSKDKSRLGMEKLEPLCKNKVPREGVVLRIHNDEVAEAFKLKTVAFRMREATLIDQGEVDMEMSEAFE